MTLTIKANEANSNGYIFDKKNKQRERKDLNKDIKKFLKQGGRIKKLK